MKISNILIFAIFLLLLTNIFILFEIKKSKSPVDDLFLEWAELLKEKGFFEYSFEAYKRILFNSNLDKKERAKISFLLAESYFNSGFFEEAYSYFLLSKLLTDEKEMLKEIEKKLVSSLELSGKSKLAEKELDKATSLFEKKGKVIAKIGREDITDEEVLSKIDELPKPLKDFYSSKEGLLNFLKSYIASKLLEKAARRANLQETEEFKKRTKEMEKDVLKTLYLEKEFKGKINIEEKEAIEYYEKNKESFKDDKGNFKKYEEVKENIYQRLYQEKQNKLLQNLIQRLFEAENVKILEN